MKQQFNISELESRWISVDEALPPVGVRLIVANKVRRIPFEAHFSDKKEFRYLDSFLPVQGVTHWRLFPMNPYNQGNASILLDTP